MSSVFDDILTVEIDRNMIIPPKYKSRVFIDFDHDSFKNKLLNVGGDWLEQTKTFAILFDTTPPDKIISDMKDYKEIVDLFPDSYRVKGKALYIGNYRHQDWNSIAKQCLDGWFGIGKYEIVEIADLV